MLRIPIYKRKPESFTDRLGNCLTIVSGTLLALTVFVIGGFVICSPDNDWVELEILRLPDSNLFLVHYEVYYGRDGMAIGQTIIPNPDPEAFNFRHVTDLNLDYIEVLRPGYIGGVELLRNSSRSPTLLPLDTLILELPTGVTVFKERYAESGLFEACSSLEYYFTDLRETSDSLILTLRVMDEAGTMESVQRSVRKGNIDVISLDGRITQIHARELIRGVHEPYPVSQDTVAVCIREVTLTAARHTNFRVADLSEVGYFFWKSKERYR